MKDYLLKLKKNRLVLEPIMNPMKMEDPMDETFGSYLTFCKRMKTKPQQRRVKK